MFFSVSVAPMTAQVCGSLPPWVGARVCVAIDRRLLGHLPSFFFFVFLVFLLFLSLCKFLHPVCTVHSSSCLMVPLPLFSLSPSFSPSLSPSGPSLSLSPAPSSLFSFLLHLLFLIVSLCGSCCARSARVLSGNAMDLAGRRVDPYQPVENTVTSGGGYCGRTATAAPTP